MLTAVVHFPLLASGLLVAALGLGALLVALIVIAWRFIDRCDRGFMLSELDCSCAQRRPRSRPATK